MSTAISLELLAFNLKLLGRQRRKTLLISAGEARDKKRMLAAIRRIMTLDVDLYATPGTHRFLEQSGVKSTEIHKITDSRSPNILSFLKANRFDLVINVLTGDEDYDESSDAKLIRKLGDLIAESLLRSVALRKDQRLLGLPVPGCRQDVAARGPHHLNEKECYR